MIEVTNISLSRTGAPILQDVSVTLPEGGISAIIGPNGAGKSTLLHCMAGLLPPDKGSIRIGGQDIHAASEAERALMLALLTQSPGLVPRLTVADLVGFGRWPHHRGRPTAADAQVVSDALDRFELHSIRDREVETLSGGQKQRAFVAMAYAQSTLWMLLDEPLAALDPRFTRDIMDRLGRLAAEGGRNIALVLHDLQIAARHATHVICMKNGRITHAGPVSEVMTSEVLSELYDTPLRLDSVDGTPVVFAA